MQNASVLHAKSIEADLAESLVTAAALVHVRKCTQLEKLTFSSVPWNDSLCETSLLETVTCFHNLRWLELIGVSAVTDTVLAAIAGQNKLLTTLSLSGCVNVSDDALKVLGQNCHFLKSLDFSSTQRLLHDSLAELVVILGRMTSQLQSLDVCLNKTIKDHVKCLYAEWMRSEEPENTLAGRLKLASPVMLCFVDS
ncbi:uncharacterized protein LOC142768270 [Rhipicephalus microplus]|uniref:uncharacterized protein LOC142768270 n=1 Tax=Rhipicephalus microplus TaxID=6941 RepID=UPI003F6C545D